MQKELRQHNSIGNAEGINKFLSLVFDDQVSAVETLNHSFRYYSLAQFNCYLALLLFQELNILKIKKGQISLTEIGNQIANLSVEQRNDKIFVAILDLLLHEKLINCDRITVDSVTGKLKIPINAFSLSAAVYRNYLYSCGCFFKSNSFFVFTNDRLREQVEEKIACENRKISQEELLRTLQKQQEDGEKGEIYVVEYEKRRLKRENMSPKRISTIDAGAGYDILSYQGTNSLQYDRYIEVKSFRGNPHFYWSSNEKSVAEALGNNYFLYLVDLDSLEKNATEYVPFIISNPAEELFGSQWLIEPNSYKITHLA